MFPLSPTMWIYVGVGVLVLALGTAVKVQSSRLESCKEAHAQFVATVKAAGDAAEAARQKDILDRKDISTKQEADNAKRYATQDARYRAALAAARVSGSNTSGGEAKPLSSAATVISSPSGQPDLAGRLASLEEGVLVLLQRGDRAIERTITCKAWIDEQLSRNSP